MSPMETVLPSPAPLSRRAWMMPRSRSVRWNQLRLSSSSKLTLSTKRCMAAASVEDVYPMVKSCGFKTKAANIVSACRLIMQNHGGEVPGSMEALTALPGVGRKTANVVLANAFGVPTIAVDTHVFRVSNRLGLADAKTVEETERQLQKAIPKKDWVAAHHWLIFHGRRVCHARGPECATCALRPLCKAARAAGGAVTTPAPARRTAKGGAAQA